MVQEAQQDKERRGRPRRQNRRRFVLYQDMFATPNGRLHGRLRRECLESRRLRLALFGLLFGAIILWGVFSEMVL